MDFEDKVAIGKVLEALDVLSNAKREDAPYLRLGFMAADAVLCNGCGAYVSKVWQAANGPHCKVDGET